MKNLIADIAKLQQIEEEKAPKGTKKPLTKWTKEKWTTSDGKPAIRTGGTTRYLPEEAWKKLTPKQKQATNSKKLQASKRGEQFVANTPAAKRAGKAARTR